MIICLTLNRSLPRDRKQQLEEVHLVLDSDHFQECVVC